MGFSRGGSNDVGGPLWCDYNEFVDILGINQIFGHTPNHIVRHHKTKNSEHYCIDIKINHYANSGYAIRKSFTNSSEAPCSNNQTRTLEIFSNGIAKRR